MRVVHVEKLDGNLVKDVSRSFYLTLRLLPADIRELISLGYLLARISDTIADTETVCSAQRQKTLEIFKSDLVNLRFSHDLSTLITESFSAQHHEGERVLMTKIREVINAVSRFSTEEQKLLQKVTSTIITGQLWDLTYFHGEGLVRVDSDDSLDLYTYQVAGCVGEFWTEVLFLHEYINEKERFLELGVRYGKGLQLTNIIRDIPEDLNKGRIYIPGKGHTLQSIIPDSDRFLELAMTCLRDGVGYGEMLPKGCLRAATILPAKLGIKTLKLIKSSTHEMRTQKVKISRGSVFLELFKAFI